MQRLTQLEERMKHLETQVGTLNDKNHIQEEEIVHMKRQMEELANIKMSKSAHHRSTRSVESSLKIAELLPVLPGQSYKYLPMSLDRCYTLTMA